jgi:hypothetical protein
MLARSMVSAAIVFTGCSFSTDSVPDGSPVGVTGQVVDFQSGNAVDAVTDITISGLAPLPKVSHDGATFTLDNVTANSVFGMLVAVPAHHSTLSQVVVTSSAVDGIKVPSVSDAFLASLATGFGATPSSSRGIVLLHLVDASGKAVSGVAGSNFTIAGTNGPHFLDPNMMAAATAMASSTSGWVVFFDVPPGLVGISQGLNVTVTIDAPSLTAAANVVTIAEGKVTAGAPVLPSNVLFASQIAPIFTMRGCIACHSGGGIGKDQAGLNLGGGANQIYKELVEERPNIRVNLAMPEKSLVLTMPSAEVPPDPHPNVTFTGPRDPDYLKLLVWIREGARQN